MFSNFILDELRDFPAGRTVTVCGPHTPPPLLCLVDKREGGLRASAVPSPAVHISTLDWISQGLCLWLRREDALSSTTTAALRSVVQTNAHKLSSIAAAAADATQRPLLYSRINGQINYNHLSCIYHVYRYLFCLFLCHLRNSSAIQAQFFLTTDGFAPLRSMCGGDESCGITF